MAEVGYEVIDSKPGSRHQNFEICGKSLQNPVLAPQPAILWVLVEVGKFYILMYLIYLVRDRLRSGKTEIRPARAMRTVTRAGAEGAPEQWPWRP